MNAQLQLRKPSNWQDFELLCKKLWGEIWKCEDTIQRNGRLGQKQNGVDVYGIPLGVSQYYGVQCKGKDEYTHAQLTKTEIDNEIDNARNWFIGFYIVEFEQNGADRAQYGEQLLKTLAKRINRKGMDWRSIYNFRTFYNVYPQLQGEIFRYLQSQVQRPTDIPVKKLQPLAAIFETAGNQALTILQPAVAKSLEPWQTAPDRLFHRISYTSLQMLSKIDDPLKRAFYEFELIQGCWTKRELDRQISALYYERSVLSKDKTALKRYIQQKADPMEPRHILRDPMTLEFLDLPEADVYTETKLETAILDNIEKFLMELGQGFCFEHRQKRILIDHDYFKADLIFYNRILHCHVIIDLKIDRYRHEYGSQLNTYKNYYRHEVMQPGDNPPIGLLLCTDYSETLVKYSTEGLEDIYVGKYLLQLPSEDTIRQYLIDNMPDQKEFEDFTSQSSDKYPFQTA